MELSCNRTSLLASGRDAAVILVTVLDAKGRAHPVASDKITFNVTGSGRLLGLGNGDPSSHESDKASTRSAFNGLATAILLASAQPGELTLEATAPGLKSGRITLHVA